MGVGGKGEMRRVKEWVGVKGREEYGFIKNGRGREPIDEVYVLCVSGAMDFGWLWFFVKLVFSTSIQFLYEPKKESDKHMSFSLFG